MNAHAHNPLPLTVIAGYLGAGKTTLLNQLLANAGERRLAVLVNDFGAINIDADLIAERNEQSISLTNGCICCSIGGALYDAIDDILRLKDRPDALIIEASGVAEPDRIANIARAEPELSLDASLVLVDALNFSERLAEPILSDSLQRQVMQADLLLISKSDLVDAAALKILNENLTDLASKTQRLMLENGFIDPDLVLGLNVHDAREDLISGSPGQHSHDAQYQRWYYQGSAQLNRDELEFFLSKLPAGILRLKGFIVSRESTDTTLIQATGKRIETSQLPEWDGETKLVAIGLAGQFDPAAMQIHFEECTRTKNSICV